MSALAHAPDFDANDIELVPMRRRHVRPVMRIESQVYERPWSAALFLQEIARRGDRFYVVARYEAAVVGYGGIMSSGLEAHITTIAVDPVYHGRHIGMKLMLCLMDAAIERGGRTVSLEVRKSNDSAQNMYDMFGFQPVGVRRGYYVETGEDAIVMWVDGVHTSRYADRLDDLRSRVEGGRHDRENDEDDS
ncbi:MAG: ribosomal protein S18-alanine N-acetyltransferase [Actinomycetota bacterium]